ASHPLLDFGNDLRLTVQLVDLKILPQQLDKRQKWTGLAKRNTVALDPGHLIPSLCQRASKLQYQARFPHATSASDAHHLPARGLGTPAALMQPTEFTLSANQGRQPAFHRYIKTRPVPTRPEDLEGAYWGTALHRHLAQLACLEEAGDALLRRGADQH